ncbi:MAG: CHRD domain-containing protein [Cyanosarcina radialis HA8281-LM2]|jgi:hypothetical protein|nr:CHRD domain-containing protein [Cyanosarcina radialis HA8281-LM2]
MKFRGFTTISAIGIASTLAFSIPGSTQSLPPTLSPLFAVLTGGNEVSNTIVPIANVGDPDGIGSITVNIIPILPPTTTLARVCFGLNVSRIDRPTALHIHRGQAGVNGGVVIPLAPLPAAGAPGVSSGCVNVANNAANIVLLAEIQGAPKNFYVNVHTAAFPNGALRGQLF